MIQSLLLGDFERKNLDLIGVYSITHISKPGIIYIGSSSQTKGRKYTKGFYSRWQSHIHRLKTNSHHSKYLQRVVNKYGIAGIKLSIIEIVESIELVLEREQYHIDLLQPEYNSAKIAGSTIGFKHSPETIAKYRLTRKGKPGHTMSEEGKKRLSEFAKSRDLSYLRSDAVLKKKSELQKGIPLAQSVYDKMMRVVYQYDTSGKYLGSFKSMADAALSTNIDRGSINNCALGKRRSAGNYKWSFSHDTVQAKEIGLSVNRL